MLDDRLPQILEKVVHETSPKAMWVHVEIEQPKTRIVAAAESEALKYDLTYVQTATGRRFLDDWTTGSRSLVTHVTCYSDGTKCASVGHDREDPARQTEAIVMHSFRRESEIGRSEAPPPVQYYFVGLTPLAEALPTAERLADAAVIGRDCDVFHFRGVKWMTRTHSLVYSLDKETGVPLRVASYFDPGRVPDGPPDWTWEAASLDRVGDRHVCLASTFSGFEVTDVGGGRLDSKLDMTQSIRVVSVEFDSAVPRTDFWPVFQPGVIVSDRIAGRSYTVPGGVPQPPKATATAVGEPIRVPEPGGGLLVPVLIAGIGAAVLVAAFVLRRRDR